MGSSASKGSKSAAITRGQSVRDQSRPVAKESSTKRRSPGRNNNNVIIYRDKGQQIPTTPTNSLIENVFLLSFGSAVGSELPEHCVFVKDAANKYEKQPLLKANNLEEAVLERVFLTNPSSVTVKSVSTIQRHGSSKAGSCDEQHVLKYLYHCYVRWKSAVSEYKNASINDVITKCNEVILQNTKTCLQQPELFTDQMIHKQFVDVCIDNHDILLDKQSIIHEFLMEILDILELERGFITKSLTPVLEHIKQRFLTEFKLMHSSEVSQCMMVLRVFTLRASVAKVFMDFNAPTDWEVATCFEDTLIGSILTMNPCPKTKKGPYEFFNNGLDMPIQEVNTTLVFIWQRLYNICDDLYKVLMACIRLSGDLRHMVLIWFGRCLHANRGKPDIWSAHEAEVFDSRFCSDGFFLNLCHVLLQMCQPFSEPNDDKLLKIKPSYCRTVIKSEGDMKNKCVHTRGLDKESTFVPYTEDSKLPQQDVYHFITECFFLTQQALHIAYSIVYKVLKLNSAVARLRRLYEAIQNSYPKRVIELVKQQLNNDFCWYLNIKAGITEYHLTKMCLKFHIATATWLVQVASSDDVTSFKPIKLPLDSPVPKTLSYIPHYIITNLTRYITELDLFNSMELVTADIETLQHYITLILVYMGNSERLVNPDVRAQLAEALEAIIPAMHEDGTWNTSKSGNAEKLLREHPLIDHLAETLLNVFVSIEMTGQNVDDEKKFNYRKSMHKILQYLWRVPLHKKAIKELAERAVSTMDSSKPPLFLRFINLLINDAIFLLDEALDHMKQIRVQEIERDSGKWSKLTPEQFRDKETGLRHLGFMGHYRNIMANHTIYTMELLTREIRPIFCHHVMVDRIAAMLTYFLEHLVGPKQRDYKVKDRKEYQFKPEQLVSDISHIYVYLGRDAQFCTAVLGESRSFSHQLLSQAVTVLKKIGVPSEFIDKFEEFSQKLQYLEVEHQRKDEIIADAPEEFLDPIMGTLMTDPIVLPTSNTTVDRAVIARHLLSDQRDPFTNMPLSMDLVKPNTELKEKIEQWNRTHLQ